MAVLVDTSVWINHFRKKNGDPKLREILHAQTVVLHDFVSGELFRAD